MTIRKHVAKKPHAVEIDEPRTVDAPEKPVVLNSAFDVHGLAGRTP